MIFRDLTLTWSLVISLKRNEDVFLVYEQILMHLFLVIFKCLLSCFTIYLENSFIFLVRPLVFVFFVNGCFSFFFQFKVVRSLFDFTSKPVFLLCEWVAVMFATSTFPYIFFIFRTLPTNFLFF